MGESNCNTQFIDYKNTGYFSKIAVDYIEQKEDLKSFFLHEVSEEGIENSINARENFPQHNRDILVEELQKQYAEMQPSSIVQQNILSLKNQNTLTITTAHQPNIFGGPLYVVYKILHVVKIAQELSNKYSDKHFVPVYYMGSEDADLDELNNITINSKKYIWHTTQTGAVGRMCVDKNLLSLIDEMQAQLGVEPFGNEWITLLKSAYQEGKNIQQATFEFLNAAFGRFGLLVIIPDNANLKRLFEPIILKELQTQFSHKALQQTVSALTEKHYHAQTEGRELNLFYLLNDKRERIEIENGLYVVRNLNLQFSQEEIIDEVKNHPERFSANVVLRGVFQETILPNIAFVGGGGELAYWLELKNVFKNASVPYPLLLLRNSFLLISERQQEIISKLNIPLEILFKKEHEIINEILANRHLTISLEEELNEIKSVYQSLKEKANQADTTLSQHVESLFVKAFKRAENLEKKIASAQRKKLRIEKSQIERLKSELFPNNSLQERVENIAGFYAKYGGVIFDDILENSLTIKSKFGIIKL
ncbi:MAG: bacillithiol biosynthesis cysteine-adding enzyme BshC [Arachidicoccus sp.]|nr:bacillithiol biosynthesis cysteine-adding enzyme BshC [Arachidicoccus sp.]